eukprot:m.271761 g.271761  ORF g.271761 m.271761 type:complete len:59 (-) comp19746_c0_seq35:99-275(-)
MLYLQYVNFLLPTLIQRLYRWDLTLTLKSGENLMRFYKEPTSVFKKYYNICSVNTVSK